jgi:hypothetical protein
VDYKLLSANRHFWHPPPHFGWTDPTWLTPPNAANKFGMKRWCCLFRDLGVHGETGGWSIE